MFSGKFILACVISKDTECSENMQGGGYLRDLGANVRIKLKLILPNRLRIWSELNQFVLELNYAISCRR
jgi:hypothetical protein